jgi:t-SNARE complex subunit (syntaxin)
MMHQLIRTEEKDFARDITSRALINTNRAALAEHRQRKEQLARLEKVEKDIAMIIATMTEIRQELKDLGASK